MTTYGEEAAKIDITVHSKNEQVFARIRGEYDVTIWITAGYLERAGEYEVATRLGMVSRLLFAHRGAALKQVQNKTMGVPSSPSRASRNAEYQERYEEIWHTEASADGSVVCSCLGLHTWTWELQPGVADRMSSDELGVVATDVANRMVQGLRVAVADLNREVLHGH